MCDFEYVSLLWDCRFCVADFRRSDDDNDDDRLLLSCMSRPQHPSTTGCGWLLRMVVKSTIDHFKGFLKELHKFHIRARKRSFAFLFVCFLPVDEMLMCYGAVSRNSL